MRTFKLAPPLTSSNSYIGICDERTRFAVQDETARTIEFAPLTSSNLGRLQEGGAKEEGSAPGSPANSPLRMAQQTLPLLDKVVLPIFPRRILYCFHFIAECHHSQDL